MNSPAKTRRSWVDWFFFDWHPAEALGAVRFYFGLGLAVYLYFQFDQNLKIDAFGAHFAFTRPIWYFGLLGIDTNVPWVSFAVMPLLLIACLFFAFGKWTKPAIIAIIIGIFYMKGVRDSFSGDVHHREIGAAGQTAAIGPVHTTGQDTGQDTDQDQAGCARQQEPQRSPTR